MNINDINEDNIYISGYTFNRKLRLLQQAEKIIQLRKKEADVLSLLCEKYPNPVSQEDFLIEVWGGGYVTSQSIAQVIRSLRLSLGDDRKSTIATISKLGYKLTIPPTYQDIFSACQLPACYQYGEIIQKQIEKEDFSFIEYQPVINVTHASNFNAIYPYFSEKKQFFPFKKLLLTATILIFGSLACIALDVQVGHGESAMKGKSNVLSINEIPRSQKHNNSMQIK